MKLIKYIYVVSLCLIISHLSFAQSGFESEDDLKKQAQELWDKSDYSGALPLYSQLLSLYPKDPSYNYHFGACMLFVEEDKSAPLRYLEFAASKPNVDPEALFYLGKGYHLNYRFEEAKKRYTEFKEKGNSKQVQTLQVDQHIRMCENGAHLLSNITDLAVLDKKTLNRSDFFRSYDVSSFGGKIITKPEDFELAFDKKVDDQDIMYLDRNADQLFYASYGDKGKTGKDIYYSNKMPDGTWGEPQSIGSTINTDYDEDYPFFNPETNTLYFASKGHNSMGGYDVFKSFYDPTSNTWGKPVNLDYAVNTPDDDFLYITNASEKTAFFATTRSNVNGEVNVYKVNVERVPVDFTIVKGAFDSEVTKSAKITVEDTQSGQLVGIWNSDGNTGDYLMTLPNGGSFKFIVETDETAVAYTGNVELPKQKVSKPLKQEIALVVENGYEKLIIKNLFDEEVSSDGMLLTADFLKNRANLQVNATESNEDETEEVVDNAEETSEETEASNNEFSNEDLVKMAYSDAEELQKQAIEAQAQTDIAYAVADMKNKQATEKSKEADVLAAEAQQNEDEREKLNGLRDANNLRKESNELAKEAVMAYNLAKKLEGRSNNLNSQSEQALEVALQLDNAINSNSQQEINAAYEKIQGILAESSNDEDVLAEATKEYDERSNESEKHIQKAIKLKEEADELEKEVARLKGMAGNTKDKEEKAQLEAMAAESEEALVDTRMKEQEAMAKAKELQSNTDELKAEAVLMADVVDEIKSTDKEAVVKLSSEDRQKLASEISTTESTIANADAQAKTEENEINELAESVNAYKYDDTNPNATTDEVNTENTDGSDNVDSNTGETSSDNESISDNTTDEMVDNTDSSEDENTSSDDNEESTEDFSSDSENGSDEAIAESTDSSENSSNNTENSTSESVVETSDDTANEDLVNETEESSANNSSSENETDETLEDNTASVEAPLISVVSSNDSFINQSEVPTENYDSYFEEKQSELASISNETERAEAEVELYEAWVGSTEKAIEEKQAQIDAEEDEVTKQLYQMEKEELIHQKETKEQQVDEAKARQTNAEAVAELEQENSFVKEDEIPDENYDFFFEEKLADAEQLEDPIEKEKAKADVYEHWVTELSNEFYANEDAMETASKSEKKDLQARNKVIESELSDKRVAKATADIEIKKLEEELGTTSTDEVALNDNANGNEENSLSTDSSNESNTEEDSTTDLESTETITDISSEESIEDNTDFNATESENNDESASNSENELADNSITEDTFNENTSSNDAEESSDSENVSDSETSTDQTTTDLESGSNDSTSDTNATSNETIENGSADGSSNIENEGESNDAELADNSFDTNNDETSIDEEIADNTSNEIESSDNSTNVNTEDESINSESSDNETADNSSSDNTESSNEIVSDATTNEELNNVESGNETKEDSANDNTINEESSNEENNETANGDVDSEVTETTNESSNEEASSASSNEDDKLTVESFDQKEYASFNLTTRVKELETDSEEMESELADVNAKIDEEKDKTELAVLEGEKASLENSIAKNKREIATLNMQITVVQKVEQDYFENPEVAGEEAEKAAARSEELEYEAIALKEQAKNKRDSSEVVKKKEQEAFLAEADRLDREADEKFDESAQMHQLAEEIRNTEVRLEELIASQEQEVLELPEVTKELTDEDKQVIAASLEYVEYEQVVTVARKKYKEADVLYVEADSLTADATAKEQEATKLREQAEVATNEEFKAQLIADAENLETEATTNKEEAKKRYASAEVIYQEADEKDQEAANYLATLEQDQYENIVAYEFSLDQDSARIARELALAKAARDAELAKAGNTQGATSSDETLADNNEAIETADNNGTNANDSTDNNTNESNNTIDSANDDAEYSNNDNTTKANNSANEEVAELNIEEAVVEDITVVAKEIDVVPTKVEKEIFVKESQPVRSAYNQNKPIPQDPKLPEGLIYKVQVGAFRNPIPQDHFKGFAPIVGESAGGGLTRYTAGIFKNINSASKARDEIRNINSDYADAFVVAYYNGERISIAEARRITAQGGTGTAVALNNTNTTTQTTNSTVDNAVVNNSQTTTNTTTQNNGGIQTSSNSTKDDAPVSLNTPVRTNGGNNASGNAVATGVDRISGLFYTVQVGVYSKRVPATQLYNITPLNTEDLPNGTVRYSSGVYTSLGDAGAAKERIQDIGIADAFVTAYYNGVRITISEARELVAQNGSAIYADGTSNGGTAQSASAGQPVDDVRFKINLGTYGEGVPMNVAGAMLRLSSSGIDKKDNGDGTTTYILGNFTESGAAEMMLEEVVDEGISGAKIIATKNGAEISIDEAKQLIGE